MRCDLAILGGGLAGGLIAHALSVRRPDLSLRLIEAQPVLGGGRVWAFPANDIEPEHRWIVEPFLSRTWNGYDVVFPAHRRSLGVRYHAVRPAEHDAGLRRVLAPDTPVHARIARASATRVVLANGRTIDAAGVIDARGPGDLGLLDIRWRKYLGRELLLDRPHGIEMPIVMDAAVPQQDGCHFMQVLPLDARRLFVAACYYSDRRLADAHQMRRRIDDYAEQHGWRVGETTAEETGVTPMLLDGGFDGYWESGGEHAAKAGARAALLHPATGAAVADAVRLAAHVAELPDLSGPALHEALRVHAARAWGERSFYRMVAKMLFHVADDDARYRLFERLYRLPPRLIDRFNAMQSTPADKLRILAGRPSLPLSQTFRALMGSER